ncbi:hypothetical protein [Salipaludibacillus agaradhaerens]|nr:hypothetical protein [Salipaludibacillus agaradhaerens]
MYTEISIYSLGARTSGKVSVLSERATYEFFTGVCYYDEFGLYM